MGISELPIENGLSNLEARKRLRHDGYNEISQKKKRGIFTIILDVLKEPMLALLLASGFIYIFLGSIDEALMLLGFVVLVIGITIYQEERTEHALEALKTLANPKALVIRDGKQASIPSREVVCGDLIFLEEGERIPADAIIITSHNLEVDESLLTGESIPVPKSPTLPDQPENPLDSQVYGSTIVTQGYATAKVTATGNHTEIGKIGRRLDTIQPSKSLLKEQMQEIIIKLTLYGLLLCAVVALLYGIIRQDWISGFLAGLALAMSLLPEEFPVILTIFLALGAWRLSQHKVLARRAQTLEMLGAADILCIDKTGTLTQNRLSVSNLYVNGTLYDVCNSVNTDDLPLPCRELAHAAFMACRPNHPDPLEKAVRESFADLFPHSQKLAKEYPLSSDRLARVQVWSSDRKEYYTAVMGSPEAVMDLCHLSKEETAKTHTEILKLADEGYRMVGIAEGKIKSDIPDDSHANTYAFLGLVCLRDPIRPEVAKAIQECVRAGIKIVMVTGDYPGTALSVANQIGLPEGEIITGDELSLIDRKKMTKHAAGISIFARIMPEQKLQIVELFKNRGHIVVMTGDGVNDAPALKAAHIGIAMGEHGTDVAREAAGIVLLKDSFASIAEAVRLGRRIFDNIRKSIAFTLAVHVPIAGLALFPALMGWPIILLPAHIAFLELIIDPACSVVFEAEEEEEDVMARPPRKMSEKLFNRRTLSIGFAQGFQVFLIAASVFIYAYYTGLSDNVARTLAFVTLIACNIGLIFTNRTWSLRWRDYFTTSNRSVWWISAGTLAILTLVITIPFTRSLFGFSLISEKQLALCTSLAVLNFLVLPVWRRVFSTK